APAGHHAGDGAGDDGGGVVAGGGVRAPVPEGAADAQRVAPAGRGSPRRFLRFFNQSPSSSPPSLVTLGYPRETSQEAEMQLDTDLRARFAKVIDSAHEAEESQARAAKPAGTPRRPYVTQGRIKLIRDMLFERFDAAEAQRRFDYFEWEKMSKARFRSEEHTSELQSRENLVCRLLLEKKNGR